MRPLCRRLLRAYVNAEIKLSLPLLAMTGVIKAEFG